jgi:hypothetical protein
LAYGVAIKLEWFAYISGIMATNLLGGVVGGLFEYNSMYFGFQALYLMAIVCYVLAFTSERLLLSGPIE